MGHYTAANSGNVFIYFFYFNMFFLNCSFDYRTSFIPDRVSEFYHWHTFRPDRCP